jgi:hypothetical protein
MAYRLKFMKDLVQAEPVYRNLPLKDGVTFTSGCAVAANLTAATSSAVELAATPWASHAGVYVGYSTIATSNASDVTTTGTIALGTQQYGKVLVNPYAIYEAEYERASYITTTGFSTATWTATHEGCAGDWLMDITTTSPAYGRILYVASTSTTTTMTCLSTPTTTPGATDNWVHVRHNLAGHLAAAYNRIDLNATGTALLSHAEYTGTGIMVIDNHIRSDKSTAYQPLRRATHDNTQDSTYKVYGEILFVKNIWNLQAA